MAAKYGTIDQYLGRTVDYSAFQGITATGDTLLDMALAASGSGGAVVTGVQKVVQRFLLELLREKGSFPLRPLGGTDFMTEARLGYLRTAIDVTGAFARAVVDIRKTLNAEESADDPAEERFADATLDSVAVTSNNAVLRIKIRTRAGDARQFIFPLPVMV